MIGRQEADRIVAAIASSLSVEAAAVLESANPRGSIMLILTTRTRDELRELVSFNRKDYPPRYRITPLGREVIAVWLLMEDREIAKESR